MKISISSNSINSTSSMISIKSSEEEKRLRRLEKNRESAKNSRRRKKKRLEALEIELKEVEAENLELRVKLGIHPESLSIENKESSLAVSELEKIITNNNNNNTKKNIEEIKEKLSSIREKYAEYGEDRRSNFNFHLLQLRSSLLPTLTTRTMIYLLSNASLFINEDGSDKYNNIEIAIKLNPNIKIELIELWFDFMNIMQPTIEQRKHFTILAQEPFQKTLNQVDNDTNILLNRIEALVSGRNASLDGHLKEVSSILSSKQVAKFILFVDKQPHILQMLDSIWPNLKDNDASDEDEK